jgi:hypothetical protein
LETRFSCGLVVKHPHTENLVVNKIFLRSCGEKILLLTRFSCGETPHPPQDFLVVLW